MAGGHYETQRRRRFKGDGGSFETPQGEKWWTGRNNERKEERMSESERSRLHVRGRDGGREKG